MKRWVYHYFVFILLCFLIFFLLTRPVGSGLQKVNFTVRHGLGAQQVALELEQLGIVENAAFFRWFLALGSYANHIQVGTYELHDGLSLFEIARKLTQGKVKLDSITIPEGWNNRQIANYLFQKKLVKSQKEFLDITKDRTLLQKYKILTSSTEGYLYPDTYWIPNLHPPHKIHEMMLKKFFDELKKLISLNQYSPSELRDRIILASIVEREARHSHERPIIAKVFLNRLEKNMKLESCATVQYTFPKSRPRLYWRDLERISPYNTYLYYGLPPGPISNPGKASLKATFSPDNNAFLYFLVKPGGSHHFSKEYKEHLEAKKKYINPTQEAIGPIVKQKASENAARALSLWLRSSVFDSTLPATRLASLY